MNYIQREPYYILTGIPLPNGGNPIMCSFCRHSAWKGGCQAVCDCEHPLARYASVPIEEMVDNAQIDGDCWMFRPYCSPGVAADIVGIWLQKLAVDWETVK